MDIAALENTIMEAINSFDTNRTALLAAAQTQGGDDAVNTLLAKYASLRAQYIRLIAAELAVNNDAYVGLSDRAGAETEALKRSIRSMNDINQTITIFSTVIGVVASIAALV
jgi:hypothetical protein